MDFGFNKQSNYTKRQIYKVATGKGNASSWRSGYERIKNDLFIFMNRDTPGVEGVDDYINRYDEWTETVIWCTKKKTHSAQPMMKQVINGDLNLYLFSRWERNKYWTYLGKAHVLSYEDGFVVPDHGGGRKDPEGKTTYCMRYQLTCKGIEEELNREEIESGILILKNDSPKTKIKKNQKRTFKGRGQTDYLLKAKKDKKLGELGEKLVLEYETKRLIHADKKKFAECIDHVSQT